MLSVKPLSRWSSFLPHHEFRKFSIDYINYIKTDRVTPDQIQSFFLAERMKLGETIKQFMTSVNTSLKQKELHHILIDSSLEENTDYDISLENPSDKVNVYKCELKASPPQNSKLILRNLYVNDLTVHGAGRPEALIIKNCRIFNLHLKDRAQITLVDSYIGALDIPNVDAVCYYEMRGGCILKINCPTPSGPNPFCGNVSLLNVFLPRNTKHYLLDSPQSYRNVKHHLTKLENTQVANIFHSAELAVERETDQLPNKVLAYIYGWSSDFGSSWFRAFLWWIGLTALSTVIIYCNDGAYLPLDEELYVGWRVILIECTWTSDLAKSFYLSWQSNFNPLGIFSARAIVIPSTSGIAVWTVIQSFISIVLITLIIFAIRRRFKIQY